MPYYRYKQIVYVVCFISAAVSTCFEVLNNLDNNKHILALFYLSRICDVQVNTLRLAIVQSVFFYDGEDCSHHNLGFTMR